MRLHRLIPGTVALWQLQSTGFADSSGNALTLAKLNNLTMSPGGVEQYGAFDACVNGFKFDGGTELIAPSSALLRQAGEWTIQFLLLDTSTLGGDQPFFCLVDPAGRSGGPSADRIGSIFTFYFATLTPGTHPYWTDQSHGSNIPVAGGNWWDTTDVQWGLAPGVIHAIAVRFGISGPTATVDLFIDGVKQPSTHNTTSVPTITGNERFYIGGVEGGVGQTPVTNSLIGSFRFLNYARSDADIAADATWSLGTCITPPVAAIDSPDPGTIASSTELVFEATANAGFDSLTAAITDPVVTGQVAWDLSGFAPGYYGTVDVITDGFRVHLNRAGGWRNGPLSLSESVVDAASNTASASRSWTVVAPIPPPPAINPCWMPDSPCGGGW